MTTDIPEHRDRKKPPPGDPRLTKGEKRGYETGTGIATMTDKEYWDRLSGPSHPGRRVLRQKHPATTFALNYLATPKVNTFHGAV